MAEKDELSKHVLVATQEKSAAMSLNMDLRAPTAAWMKSNVLSRKGRLSESSKRIADVVKDQRVSVIDPTAEHLVQSKKSQSTEKVTNSQRYRRDMTQNIANQSTETSPQRTASRVALYLTSSPGSSHELGASTSNSLPRFIKRLPTHLDFEELFYMETKGALTLPDRRLRNKLLKAFMENVYPSMPLISLHQLRCLYYNNEKAADVSILLFQAIMFSAIAFVNESLLQVAGFQDRTDASRSFFGRVKLLHEFDVEPDRISQIQALLLMTYANESAEESEIPSLKASSHWMGIAIYLAQTIGLFSEKVELMAPEQRRLWRRIAWSVYVRDRVLAFNLQQPAQIPDEDFMLPMLSIDDFELVPQQITLGDMIYDRFEQYEMAEAFVEKARMYKFIGDELLSARAFQNVNVNPTTGQSESNSSNASPGTSSNYMYDPFCGDAVEAAFRM